MDSMFFSMKGINDMARDKNYETTYYNAQEVRRAAQQQARLPVRHKKNRRRGVVIYLVCVVLVSAILAGVGWLLANDLCALNKDYVEATIVVEEKDNVRDVAKKLKKAGLINNKSFFCFVGRFMHAGKKIDPGTYENLNTNMDYRSLISNLHDYEAERREAEGLIRLTITEGMTVREVIDLLAENGIAPVEELEDACANYEFKDYSFLREDLKGNIARVEGYLFPDTYDFSPDKSAVFAIDTMLTAFVNQLDGDVMSVIDNIGYSLPDVITIASLIERETDGTDRAKIASVIYNRLENVGETSHFLQVDASLAYVLGREVMPEDYETLDSDYNLYRHPGLPPTPIGNPGRDSLLAAIYPENTDYYYYVLGSDGRHIFSRTLAEHNAAMNQ